MGVMEQILEQLKLLNERIDNLERPMNQDDGVYNVQEAAEYLGISETKMYDMVKKGEIPFVSLGHRKVIPKKQLLEWIQNNVKDSTKKIKPKFKNNISYIDMSS